MIKLLLVEDDKNLSYIVQSGLQDIIGGYEVITTPLFFLPLHLHRQRTSEKVMT